MRRILIAAAIAVVAWPAWAQDNSSGSEPPPLPHFPSDTHGPAFSVAPSEQQPGPSTGTWNGEGWYHMYSTALMGSSAIGGPYPNEDACTASYAAQSTPNDQCVFY